MGDRMVSLMWWRLLQASVMMGANSLTLGLMSSIWAAGSDTPETTTVQVGFIPLIDRAPLVVATLKGFDRKHDITLVPIKEASQAAVRDRLVSEELNAARALHDLLYGLELGIVSKVRPMANLMTLSQNDQVITLSAALPEQGIIDASVLKRWIVSQAPGTYTFAHASPTGTHTMWPYYWLASTDINPLTDVRTVTVLPPQVVMNMHIGNTSGSRVDEPWNARAIDDRISFTMAMSQDIWSDHPEKVFGTCRGWVEKYPRTARALVSTLLEVSR